MSEEIKKEEEKSVEIPTSPYVVPEELEILDHPALHVAPLQEEQINFIEAVSKSNGELLNEITDDKLFITDPNEANKSFEIPADIVHEGIKKADPISDDVDGVEIEKPEVKEEVLVYTEGVDKFIKSNHPTFDMSNVKPLSPEDLEKLIANIPWHIEKISAEPVVDVNEEGYFENSASAFSQLGKRVIVPNGHEEILHSIDRFGVCHAPEGFHYHFVNLKPVL